MRITKGNPEIRVDRRLSEDDGVGNGYHAARRVLASLAPTTPTSLTPPGYQLIDTLGVGGGGATFLALREGSDRPVALKVLHAHAAPGPTRQRAWRELDLLQETHLPCLPRLLDYGVVGDRLFIATEFVSGQRLDEHARSIPPSRERWHQLALVLARVAEAVHSLNERGIIHRDLKPSNILIARDASPFIIDLGVAALAARSAEETLTADGTPIGTPAFMSPEQARGERELISIRSDVYALGATACAVMTGKPPHDLEGVSLHEAVRRVGSEPPREARVLEPELPRPLSAIIAKACALHPRERYATAAELAEDLRRFTRHEPVLATRPSAWQRAMRWVGRHPKTASALASTTIFVSILAGSLVVARYLTMRPSRVVVSDDQQTAQLCSVAGLPIHTWRTEAKWGVRCGGYIRDPVRGDLLYLAGDSGDLSMLSGGVGVFDPDSLDEPVWTSARSTPAIRRPDDLYDPRDTFRALYAVDSDVFPEEPGVELLVIYGHESAGSHGIRVHAMRTGEVLYEAWHDGSLGRNLVWLDEPRLLMFAGISNPLREEGLRRSPPVDRYPGVVFAIRPELHQFCGWANRSNQANGLRPPKVVWYKTLTPPETTTLLPVIALSNTTRAGRWGAEVQLNLESDSPGHGVGLFIGGDGALCERVAADGYLLMRERAATGWPDPVSISLEDVDLAQ